MKLLTRKKNAFKWDKAELAYQWGEFRYAPGSYIIESILPKKLARKVLRAWDRYIHEPWYWLRCRVWYQYNTVRSRYLPPTYHDPDRLLFYIAFQVFEDFIEKEKPWEPFATEEEVRKAYAEAYSDEKYVNERVERAREIRELYEWWKARVKRDDSTLTLEAEDLSYEEDNEKLRILVKNRESYWT